MRAGDRSVRSAAAWALDRGLASRRPVDGLLAELQAGFDDRSRDSRDSRLLRELVLGSLRWLKRLDSVLGDASSRPLARVDGDLLAPLRIGAYQLLYLDRVPAYAAVSEAVDEASRRSGRRAGGFVNGVLRRIAARPSLAAWPVQATEPLARLAVETSYPEFLVERWASRFGAERARELLDAGNRPAAMHLLSFRDRGGCERLASALAEEGVATEPTSISPLGLAVRGGDALSSRAFREGLAYVQDQASQAAALVPPPRPGERILDVAAPPGGKSFAAAAWEPAVRLYAGDRSLKRLLTMRRNAARLDLDVAVAVADASRPAFRGGFDRVVLDLPCSGTGTLRRHPELKWRLSPAEIRRLAAEAWAMLVGAAPLVVAGGLLVAITCSLEPEENEILIRRFLTEIHGFSLMALENSIDGPLASGIAGPGRWRLLTGDDHDGFTVHVLRRSG